MNSINSNSNSDDYSNWAPESPAFERLEATGIAHLPPAPLGMKVLPPSSADRKKHIKGTTSKPYVLLSCCQTDVA
jgi:hypothetical protein